MDVADIQIRYIEHTINVSDSSLAIKIQSVIGNAGVGLEWRTANGETPTFISGCQSYWLGFKYMIPCNISKQVKYTSNTN